MLLIFETHPVQYHAPVYRLLAQEFGISLKVIYGADFSVRGYKDIEFGTDVKWDTDLLGGYSYEHIAEQLLQAGRPIPNNYNEVTGFGVVEALARNPAAVVLALGYTNSFDRTVIKQTLVHKVPLMVRFEANDVAQQRSGIKRFFRTVALRVLYWRTARALYIGQRAKEHYLRHGLARHKLSFSPYCVDVSHCRLGIDEIADARAQMRARYAVGAADTMALFAGKLSARKGVREWVSAALSLPIAVRKSLVLAFVGAGELEAELRHTLAVADAPRSIFFGFKNQSELSEIYAASDFGVLPSIEGETWGLVVNESLHHGRPVLVSERVGSAVDLIVEGSTGAIAAATSESLALACMRILLICRDPLTFLRCRTQVERYSVYAAAKGIARAYAELTTESAHVSAFAQPRIPANVALAEKPRVAVLGQLGYTNLGFSIHHELLSMGIAPVFFSSLDAYRAGLAQRLMYRLNRTPLNLNAFADDLAQSCIEARIDLLISTGICPLTEAAVEKMARHGVATVNWLSDDPWNSANRNRFFLPTFKHMAAVFTPRHANIDQLRAHGAKRVEYLPFAADQRFFKPRPYADLMDIEAEIDLLFVGGADIDRRQSLKAVPDSDVKLAIYGDYWHKDARYRVVALGIASPEQINAASQSAKVCLILVRRANRDGHVMRSLEAAASGACMLVEHTAEHEALFGTDGECVRYFYDDAEILPKTLELLANPSERHRLRQAVVRMMHVNAHTYRARVLEMMRIALPNASIDRG